MAENGHKRVKKDGLVSGLMQVLAMPLCDVRGGGVGSVVTNGASTRYNCAQ